MNERKRFEFEMKRILEHIIVYGDIPELGEFGRECLHECSTRGFVAGIKTKRMASGNIVWDKSGPRVLKPGLDFCYPRSTIEAKINIALLLTTVVSVAVAIIQTVRY